MREIETRRWTREEYYRMADGGVLGPDERVELIDGEIINVPCQSSRHATAIRKAEEVLRNVFGKGFDVRVQLPLVLDLYSEPEPDVSVVRGSFMDYRDSHPSTALLVVEVSDSTLKLDRELKGSLYARAGIPEYWIINLVEGVVEVFRDPVASETARYGWEYKSHSRFSAGQSFPPLHVPEARIDANDLLP